MSHLDKHKTEVIGKLRGLCWKCSKGLRHVCPVAAVIRQIQLLRGVPVIVNDKLHHVMFL